MDAKHQNQLAADEAARKNKVREMTLASLQKWQRRQERQIHGAIPATQAHADDGADLDLFFVSVLTPNDDEKISDHAQ